MKILQEYQNGNTKVQLFEDGTKVREWPDGEKSIVEYPESVDVKITNFCTLGSSICEFCHEQSNLQGKHGDLDLIADIWDTYPFGGEMAVGGGDPLSHPDVEKFLKRVTNKGHIPNFTINALHIKKYAEQVRQYQEEKLIYGVGISYRGKEHLKNLPTNIKYDNVVFHMILGLNNSEDCQAVINWCEDNKIYPKILLLGYKQYGNGTEYYKNNPWLETELNKWKTDYLKKVFNNNVVVSFDNLAIKQLDLKNKIGKKKWEQFYQGDDGSHTFYVDAVKQEVAMSSTSPIRYKINKTDTIKDIFEKVKIK